MKANGSFSLEDAGFNVGVNVRLTQRNAKTGRVMETREGHNTCLKMQLMGIVKWLNGEFNDTQDYLLHYDWIPRYLAVGTNQATYESSEGVKSEVNVNDTRLLTEISPRIPLPERNKVINKSTQRYIQLVITTYIPSEYYNGETISEAGLFSRATGNNCLFRIVFDGINKTEDSVIEVSWTISVISVESDGNPYEEVDKEDLRRKLNEILDTLGKYDPNSAELKKILKDMIDKGIIIYGKQSVTQTQVDDVVRELDEDLEDLKASNPDLR